MRIINAILTVSLVFILLACVQSEPEATIDNIDIEDDTLTFDLLMDNGNMNFDDFYAEIIRDEQSLITITEDDGLSDHGNNDDIVVNNIGQGRFELKVVAEYEYDGETIEQTLAHESFEHIESQSEPDVSIENKTITDEVIEFDLNVEDNFSLIDEIKVILTDGESELASLSKDDGLQVGLSEEVSFSNLEASQNYQIEILLTYTLETQEYDQQEMKSLSFTTND